MKKLNILLVEDGEYKSNRITAFLKNELEINKVTLRKSYSSAVKELVQNRFDFAIIDMSLPTFDQTETDISDDFRAFGGLDIARQIKRRSIDVNFLFLTQHLSLIEDSSCMDLSEIDFFSKKNYEKTYKGIIYYEHSGSLWKESLKGILGNA